MSLLCTVSGWPRYCSSSRERVWSYCNSRSGWICTNAAGLIARQRHHSHSFVRSYFNDCCCNSCSLSTNNEAGTSGTFAPEGAVGPGTSDLYSWDAYPQRYDCAHPEIWHEVITTYNQSHIVSNINRVLRCTCSNWLYYVAWWCWSRLGVWRISRWLFGWLGRGISVLLVEVLGSYYC